MLAYLHYRGVLEQYKYMYQLNSTVTIYHTTVCPDVFIPYNSTATKVKTNIVGPYSSEHIS